MNFRRKAVMFLATGGYIGNVSVAPGTLGSIPGLLLCFLLSKMALPIAVLAAGVFIFLAVWIAQEAEKILNQKDPGAIVIDEVAGVVVALFGLPFNLFCVTISFLLFRILDIFKPFPIGLLERRFSGGTGIVVDDVAAGLISNFTVRVILLINS